MSGPRCIHFGTCGGCQYQDIAYEEQLRIKLTSLRELLLNAACTIPTAIATHQGDPYEYRNRIRLRTEPVQGELRLGYNKRATTEFLPISMCPIAAPLLWKTADSLLHTSVASADAATCLQAANEVELFTNDTADKVQLTFACAPRTKRNEPSFTRAMQAISEAAPQVVGAGAIAVDPRTGPTGRVFASWGAAGLNYRVNDATYWITRGGFFQVNRFLLPKLVELVCSSRGGNTAWDLFAGVGLFSRILAKSFAKVTAVESNPTAARDLGAALQKLAPQHRAIEATTLDFLRRAILERERPELIVLDPPRAGAGIEACELIAKLAPREIVYVSCDPTTLARDWKALENGGYHAQSTHLVDLFPQTFHLETVVTFTRNV